MAQTQDPKGILGANDCRRRYLPQAKSPFRIQSHDRPILKKLNICRELGTPSSRFLTTSSFFTKKGATK